MTDKTAHERGLEKAASYYDTFESMMREHTDKEAVAVIIRAYLEASGLVLVPREPDDRMNSAGICVGDYPWDGRKPSRVFKAMLLAFPNPFESKL